MAQNEKKKLKKDGFDTGDEQIELLKEIYNVLVDILNK